MIIQIYEVQTPSEAEALIKLGVNHIGSVLLSREDLRNPLLHQTIQRVKALSAVSSLIPLFNDQESIFSVLKYYSPHIIHFCEILTEMGNLSSQCDYYVDLQKQVKTEFPDVKIMRSLPIRQAEDSAVIPTLELMKLFEPVSDYFLTDTLVTTQGGFESKEQPVDGFVGITGKTCDWGIAKRLVQDSHIPVILAGGISPENVYDGVLYTQPAGVDSCTQTNSTDRHGHSIRFKKDIKKVKKLIKEAHRAQSYIDQT